MICAVLRHFVLRLERLLIFHTQEVTIDLYKALGRWMERDDYKPKIGDVVVYAWSDNGVGECTTGADHVGIVTKVSGTSFWVTEGNYRDSVKTRSMQVNGRYIRGFGLPDYAKKATGVASAMPTTTVTEKTLSDYD